MVEGIKPTDRLVFDLRIKQIDQNKEKTNALREEIAKKYGVPVSNVKINVIPITISDKGEKLSLVSEKINSIHIPEYQQGLFKEWLELNKVKDYDFDKILDIDRQVNAFVDFDEYTKYKQYKFKYVKWDNFLSYGKGNYFDFTKLNGLVLLNSFPENQSGKTTFAIELVRFALFGKSNKVPTLDKAFNSYLPEETKVLVEAGIEIDGVDYVIRRTLERPALSKRTEKSKVKQTLEYFKTVDGTLEKLENCEGESSTATNIIIREAVGGVDDFDLVISATSKTLSDLLDMGQTDKSRLFAKWLGLLTIEKKNEIAKNIWKENISTNLISNTYNRETLSDEIKNYSEEIANDENRIKSLESSIISYGNEVSKKSAVRDEVYKRRKPIDESVKGLDAVTIDNNISMKRVEYEQKKASLEQLETEYAEKSLVSFDNEEYNRNRNTLEAINNEILGLEGKNGELRGRIGALRADNERINKLISENICPTCGHPIDINEQAAFVERNRNAEKGLINEGVSNKNRIDSLKSDIEKIKGNISVLENNRDTVNEAQRISLRITALKSTLESINLNIEKLEGQKALVEKNRENVLYNNTVEIEINNITAEINELNKMIASSTGEKESLAREIRTYTEEIEKRNLLIERLKEEEVIIKSWNIYQELVGKNGITKIVLRGAIPIINNEIARLLDGICDFEVRLDMDEKNNVGINLHKDGVVMDMGTCSSGFESVVSSLALRSALGNMSSLSKSNFFCTDEIMGPVGVENYDKVHELYNRILTNYDFILNITHNELIYDWHDQNISVVKEGNVSKIIFNEKN